VPDAIISPETATELLQSLLAQQTKLTIEHSRANDLQEQELRQKQQALDLQAKEIALRRETLNRAEARLQEVLQRFINAESKLITLDDSFGETVQRIIVAMREITAALIDVEKSNYALLTQNSSDIRDARLGSPDRLQRMRKQELLLQHQETLHTLQLQAAAHGSLEAPVKLLRQIEAEQAAIEQLTSD